MGGIFRPDLSEAVSNVKLPPKRRRGDPLPPVFHRSVVSNSCLLQGTMKLCVSLIAVFVTVVSGFAPFYSTRRHAVSGSVAVARHMNHFVLYAKDDEEDKEEEEKKENPYQDPNYPDLEFVDYSDPEYQVDRGIGDDEFFSKEATEEQIEAMREERRRRNDEFQFETYFAEVLKKGQEYKGEWTVYKMNHDMLDDNGFPRFHRAKRTMKVVSKGSKHIIDPNAEWRVDGERLIHTETAVAEDEGDPDIEWLEDPGNGYESTETELSKISAEANEMEKELMAHKYWPESMSSFDFRGQQGNMCVGNAFTICSSVPLNEDCEYCEGPFSELRTELGIQSDQMRFRVKLDYGISDEDAEEDFPFLLLKSLIVCRESMDLWPRDSRRLSAADGGASSENLFGAAGASGGLYDPPPVGCEEQSGRYMMMDLDGGATLLFPYKMDQHPDAFDGNGWVTSLDWTPGRIRYQVDRKVEGGKKLMGLRSLELSEVQGVDADTYRPRDGGSDMRQ